MSDILQNINCIEEELLSSYTTFRTGGKASRIFIPKNKEEIIGAIDYCKKNKIRYYILGNGSNVLFTDEGYDGAIILISRNISEISISDNVVTADAGASLAKIAAVARNAGLTGLEFAAGIPGTLGGAVVMNAGAYGGEMKDVIQSVDIMYTDGHIETKSCADMDFSYRHSVIDENMIVLGAKIKLQEGEIDEIDSKMQQLKEARISKQPLEYPSAGSTFKRPEGYFAAKLIEDAGLKGYKHGGAMVSDKHAGFVINYDKATSSDIIELINYIISTVQDKFGVLLEPEVRIIR